MQTTILFLVGGAVIGFVLGHVFAAMFDIRSKDNPGVPNENVAIVAGILGAVIGGAIGIYS